MSSVKSGVADSVVPVRNAGRVMLFALMHSYRAWGLDETRLSLMSFCTQLVLTSWPESITGTYPRVQKWNNSVEVANN